MASTHAFVISRDRLDAIMTWLASEEATALDLATLERVPISEGEELLAQVLQDYENLRLQDEAEHGRSPRSHGTLWDDLQGMRPSSSGRC